MTADIDGSYVVTFIHTRRVSACAMLCVVARETVTQCISTVAFIHTLHCALQCCAGRNKKRLTGAAQWRAAYVWTALNVDCLCERTAVQVTSQEDVCSPNPCLNSGRCFARPADEISPSSPLQYGCTCFYGWWGTNCSHYNPCYDPGACSNGGTCRNTSSVTYDCQCPSGFFGAQCQVRAVFENAYFTVLSDL